MAKDAFHDLVKDALIQEDWKVTDNPLTLLSRAEGGLVTDLGAEKIIVAEKGLTKIAVEIKSFTNPSLIHDFLRAIGQYTGYSVAIRLKKLDRKLYLAMPAFAYEKLIIYDFVQAVIEENSIKFILFDPQQKIIVSWKE